MKNKAQALAILFIILFLVMVGFGLVIPIMPFLLVSLGGNVGLLGVFMAVYSLMHFLCAPAWGRLSDRIGRRPVILIGIMGYAVTFILFGLADSLVLMFVIRILAGALSSAALPTAMAYIADLTGEEERSKSMGWLSAALGMGMIFGPALGGWLGQDGFALPFFVAGSLALLTFPLACKFLPETHKIHGPSAYPAPAFSSLAPHGPLLFLFVLTLILNFSTTMFETTFVLFSAQRAAFGPLEIGILFTVLGICGVVVQAGLIGRLVSRFGDINLVKGGVVIAAAGLLLLTFATNFLSIMITAIIYNVGTSLLGPSTSTLVTQHAGSDQGAALGMMQSLGSLGRIIGPVIGGGLYEINIFAPYLAGGLFLLGAYLAIKTRWPAFITAQPTGSA